MVLRKTDIEAVEAKIHTVEVLDIFNGTFREHQ